MEERLLHDLIVSTVRKKLSREYSEIRVNFMDERKNEFHGHYPDIILISHGMVVGVIEVEIDTTLKKEKIDIWKEMIDKGIRFTLLVPENEKVRATELLWQAGLMGKVNIGTFDIRLSI